MHLVGVLGRGVGHLFDLLAGLQGKQVEVGGLLMVEATFKLLLLARSLQSKAQLAVRGVLALQGEHVGGDMTLLEWDIGDGAKERAAGGVSQLGRDNAIDNLDSTLSNGRVGRVLLVRVSRSETPLVTEAESTAFIGLGSENSERDGCADFEGQRAHLGQFMEAGGHNVTDGRGGNNIGQGSDGFLFFLLILTGSASDSAGGHGFRRIHVLLIATAVGVAGGIGVVVVCQTCWLGFAA